MSTIIPYYTRKAELTDTFPSLIQAAFMYAYPGESFQSIVDRYISGIELRGGSILDAGILAPRFIYLEADYHDGEWPTSYYECSLDYILTFQFGAIMYDVGIVGRRGTDINILRLSMFLYLTAYENCIPVFNHSCPIWFYDPYNLEAVTSVLSEDVGNGYYDVLKGYISYMDKVGRY